MFRRSFLAGLAGIVVASAAALPAQATSTRWVMLGEQTVSTHADRDVLVLGADEGRFEALKFQVFGNRVAFAEVRVVFGNGTSQILNVREHMRPGDMSPAYDLEKQHRLIRRIEFLYQAEKPWKGDATIKIYGLKDSGGFTTGDWTVLGKREVSLVTDRDTINLGYDAGKFRSIRFHVSGEPIHLCDIRVTFGNGQVQTLSFDEHIPAGAYSRAYDLPGNERVISRIDLVYKKSHRGGQALMTVYGLS
jgi:hypothetical protein